jgi:dienelactone hydrolase
MRLLVALLAAVCPFSAAAIEESKMVAVALDGRTVAFDMRIFKPEGDGPFPTLVFNHGSTGNGRDPALFTRAQVFRPLADLMVAQGWVVVTPHRRGRGNSEGLYDEGFGPDRSKGYSCEPAQSLPGADRALRDIAAAMAEIERMPFVDKSRIAIGGQSRGGILAVAYSGLYPQQVKAVINFVGGWMGASCGDRGATINKTLFKRGAGFAGETLWLYGDNDPYYPLSHSRRNFETFQSAGGKGEFLAFQPVSVKDGHAIVFAPALWEAALKDYLKRMGLL